MNEWGVPDWRAPKAYGDVNEWTMDRWRWEFYRRRDDLRAFFDRWAEETHKNSAEANAGLGPNDPGFFAFGNEGRPREGIQSFGYIGVPNPRIGAQPRGTLITFKRLAWRRGYITGDQPGVGGRSIFPEINARPDKEFRVWLEPQEMTIRFDLSDPLEPQIEEARRVLRLNQLKCHDKLVQTRRHPTKWLGYLRTLDARKSKATWQEITDVFFAEGILDRVKDPKGGYRPPPPQAARDKWESANALCFNF